MKKISFFRKLSLTAAVCAASCVGRGEREKIKISVGALEQVRAEIGEFFGSWRKSNLNINIFYKYNHDLFKRDFLTLHRILTKDLLENLAWGADKYVDFSEFEKSKFGASNAETDRWKFVRDFLYYAFNGSVPVRFRKACYGLEIFNHTAAGHGNCPRELFFIGKNGKLDREFMSQSAWKDFCDKVVKILWADVSRWFKETTPARQKKVLDFFIQQGGDQRKFLELFEHMCSGSESAKESRLPRGLVMKERYGSVHFPSLEAELLVEDRKEPFAFREETKLQILEIIKDYLFGARCGAEFSLEEGWEDSIFVDKRNRGIIFNKTAYDFRFNRIVRRFGERDSICLLSCSRADCAVLFRFFTRKMIDNFLNSWSLEGKSFEERRAFVKERKSKKRFRKHMTEYAKEVFGCLKTQYFDEGSERWHKPVRPTINAYPGFDLCFVNFSVRRTTLFNSHGWHRYDVDRVFSESFLDIIADLLYPEVEAYLNRLSAELEKTAKK